MKSNNKKKTRTDILDELDASQLARLMDSVQQVKSGKTFTHDEMKKEIQLWLAKK